MLSLKISSHFLNEWTPYCIWKYKWQKLTENREQCDKFKVQHLIHAHIKDGDDIPVEKIDTCSS
jgi:hypothetical protein